MFKWLDSSSTLFIYIYLFYDKTEARNSFKIYKIEVEKQLSKQIKIIQYDKG